MQFKMFSIAAHSTWLYNGDHDFAIDAGEGIATHLGLEKMAALKTVLLTHDHYDHVVGLVQLLNLRERMKNGKNDLVVYYPYDSHKFDAFRRMLPDRADWVRVDPGDRLRISKTLSAVPIPVNHARGKAVGYQILDARTRKKAEYASLSSGEIAALARKAVSEGRKPDFSEDFDYHYLTHTGDTLPLTADVIGRPEVLIHEATYPTADMIVDHEHSTLVDALAAWEKSGAKSLIVNHLSRTYRDVVDTVDFRGAMVVSPVPSVQTFVPGGEANQLKGRSGNVKYFNPTSLLLRR